MSQSYVTDYKYIREAIREDMDERNLTNKDMARRIGVSTRQWLTYVHHPERLTLQKLLWLRLSPGAMKKITGGR